MILIVDDSPFERTVMRAILEEAGFEVHEAQSGVEGLAEAARLQPKLMMTDVIMPELDGLEMTRRLRQTDRTTPVVMVTGLEDPRVILEGLEAGVDGFLPKPYSHAELTRLVESFLRPDGLTVHADRRHLYTLLRSTLERQGQLQQRLEEGERRQKRVLSLLAALDSELRGPLGGLRGWFEQRSHEDAMATMALRRVERLTTRLDELVEMRRLETGEVPLDRVRVGVAEALLEAMESARLRGLQVRSAPLAAGLAVRADASRVQQALTLLINLAARGGPVSVRAFASGPNVVFELRSRKEEETGDPAALAMTRQLVELQGGSFTQEVRAGRGTTWRFSLPGDF